MKRSIRQLGLTLVEMLISMGASVVVIGALLVGTTGLQKSLRANETYADLQASQRRLLDYLSRDLRRSIALSATTQNGLPVPKLASQTIDLVDQASLEVELPAYYRGNTPATKDYDQPLEVVVSDGRVGYGNEAGVADSVKVKFRKGYSQAGGSVCFIRQEAGQDEVIVKDAADMQLRVTVDATGRNCSVEVWFRSPHSGIRPLVSTFDQIMLRNLRIDRP